MFKPAGEPDSLATAGMSERGDWPQEETNSKDEFRNFGNSDLFRISDLSLLDSRLARRYLAALPAMSLIPFAPFGFRICHRIAPNKIAVR
jgi:hypothetical protein